MNSRDLLKEIQTKMTNKLDIKPVEWLVFVDKYYWGNEAFSGITESFKKFLIGQIDKLAKENVKIWEEVLWQSLVPQSFLGKIFSFKRLGRAACTAKGSLKWVAIQLDRLELPYHMEKETLQVLVSTDALLIDLDKHHPNLFSKLQAHYLANLVKFESVVARSLTDYANISFDFSGFGQSEVADKKEDAPQNTSSTCSGWPLDEFEKMEFGTVSMSQSEGVELSDLNVSTDPFAGLENIRFGKEEKSNCDNGFTFFRKNSNTVVYSTIATPEGRRENSEIFNKGKSKKPLFTIR